MPYPQFPTNAGARPMWFSTFDPRFRSFAATSGLASPGERSIYNESFNGGVPALWTSAFVMFQNAGNLTRTVPIVWGGWVGPRPVMWLAYAGGEVPD